MILSLQDLLNQYKDYTDPQGKISRMVKKGELYRVTQGIYETNRNVDGKKLAQVIYHPSYLSFTYVLSLYSLIPEGMYYTYTCATFRKNKKKTYQNVFGTFYYQDVPEAVFPLGVEVKVEDGYCYHIATKEKALLDFLYSLSPVFSLKAFKALLIDDLRMDMDALFECNIEWLIETAPLYHSTNLKWLIAFLKEAKNNG